MSIVCLRKRVVQDFWMLTIDFQLVHFSSYTLHCELYLHIGELSASQ